MDYQHSTTTIQNNTTIMPTFADNVTSAWIGLTSQNSTQDSWGNVSGQLSDWQKTQLQGITSESGIRCMLDMWFNYHDDQMNEGLYCNATWDNVYCWPPAPAGTVVTQLCSIAFQETRPQYAGYLEGNATRICQENGTWLWGTWTDYEECATSYEAYEQKTTAERQIVSLVQHTLFYGSILSLLCLATALSIFYYFRCLWCDRIKIQSHLMIALVLRSILLLVITEPFVLNRSTNYRDVDILCKAVISLYLYATVASVSWMLIQGIYLNSKLTTNLFDGGSSRQIILYCLVGWLLPAVLLSIYLVAMVINQHPENCWKGYAEMLEIWILLGPMIFAMLLIAALLVNILRIVMEKSQSPNPQLESSRVFSAAKATIILFPVLGLNNLLLLYNPGGSYEKYYVVLNTFFGATQGIFVAIVYCFTNGDVHDAIRRSYNRFVVRRSIARMSREINSARRSSDVTIPELSPSQDKNATDVISSQDI